MAVAARASRLIAGFGAKNWRIAASHSAPLINAASR